MKPISKISAAVVAGALSLGTMAATAEASSATPAKATGTAVVSAASAGYLSGSCRASRGNYGNLKAYYYTSGSKDYFNQFNWYLAGPGLRNKNNVYLRVREHLNGRADRTLWSWASGDNVRRGTGGYSARPGVGVPRRAKVHVDFSFIFDRSGSDPRCTGRTNSV
ncbi:hypothetical protein FHR32_001168 [Streptosporangium album]|uniref:Peptidase inhibitor family I36 n=1 Tax=Streptosporangium album TaxID=47479 RepID=A0A7W7RSN0_9ACTN|nr:hypothetical protein [Streptosporangium album]MBB4936863.1 hypothetical protein [Streptosporangium album]